MLISVKSGTQFRLVWVDLKSNVETENKLKAENKELKFQVQSAKYKIIDLQNRLIDNQIDLAKAKKKGSGEINVLNR